MIEIWRRRRNPCSWQIAPWNCLKGARKSERTVFDINFEKRVVFTRLAKKVTVTDVRDNLERLRAHPGFDPDFPRHRRSARGLGSGLGAADFLKLADELDCFAHEAWRALLVPIYVQNHAAHTPDFVPTGNRKNFSSPEEAREWIESRPAHRNDEPITN
jgi:hypothetical protein